MMAKLPSLLILAALAGPAAALPAAQAAKDPTVPNTMSEPALQARIDALVTDIKDLGPKPDPAKLKSYKEELYRLQSSRPGPRRARPRKPEANLAPRREQKPPAGRAGIPASPGRRTRTAPDWQSPSAQEQDGAPAPEASNSALGGARSLAQQLQRRLSEPQEAAASSPAANQTQNRAQNSAPAATRLDPANPSTQSELLLASMVGFRGAFQSLGLKAAGNAILRGDGRPATARQLDALKARIREEPLALMQRPDFFKALPRERFQELKSRYQESDPRRASDFKHVALSESQRDFAFSGSCDSVSGDCNPYLRGRSYQRGKYVPPEDLAKIWKGIREMAEAEENARRLAPAPKPARRAPPRGSFNHSRVATRIQTMLDAIAGTFGIGARGRPGASSSPRAALGRAAAWTAQAFTPGPTVASKPRRLSPDRISPPQPSATAPARKKGARWPWWLLAASLWLAAATRQRLARSAR